MNPGYRRGENWIGGKSPQIWVGADDTTQIAIKKLISSTTITAAMYLFLATGQTCPLGDFEKLISRDC
jgi:hypothetical protein